MDLEKFGLMAEKVREFFLSAFEDLIGEAPSGLIYGYDRIFLQLREIFIMAVCGACIAFFFEVYDSLIPYGDSRGRRWLKGVFDLLFCLMAAMIAARFWYISSYGRISFHETVSLIAGILLGRSVFFFKKSKRIRAAAAVYVIMLITAYILIS